MKKIAAGAVFAAALMLSACQTTGAGGQAAIPGAYVPTPQEQAIQQAAIAQAGAAGAFNYNAAQAAAGGALANQAVAGAVGQGLAAAIATPGANAPIAASQPDDGQKSCAQLAAEMASMNEIVAKADNTATTSQVASIGIGLAQTFGGYFGGGAAVNAIQASSAVDSANQQQRQAAQVQSQQAQVRMQVLAGIAAGKGC
ncbi:conserved hypothetical protein [Parvibaculum lavamentivorans DS-1]|uniref:Lipoprotein n=1 Tax=Parvibaculum lavamentivorans (strain DS-1 / DSM 13023 / NCIMB 13966) TaxID=402881 RepID=A7HUR8_PARL1|nr:hypothetical protein [Parvibaculum lavamentivorans]ABS63651.1 conserved hypothetical protein [Parvibaculum lavamentivorans DS-1]